MALATWHQLDVRSVEKKLNTNIKSGLTSADVATRRDTYGKNVFTKARKETMFGRVAAQIKNPLVFILFAAGFGTLALAEYTDTIVIFIAVTINITVGVFQEKRASQAFEKLAASQEKYATVVRNGNKALILSEELVPGDVIIIEAGTSIPADCRIVEQKNLSVNESALTGEWINVAKNSKVIKKDVPITDRHNMLWMGTLTSDGVARAVVVETGDHTQLGTIARGLAYKEESRTPLQMGIRKLAHFLMYVTISAIVVILLLGIIREEPLAEMLLVAIALAVAVIPEGLPVAVTVVLALGMEAILKKGGLVRNLLAAETLGSTTMILTDKTGTLTKAEMRVASVISIDTLDRPGNTARADELSVGGERDVLDMAIMVSDAFVEGKEKPLAEWVVRGRPVECAVILAGLESGVRQEDIFEKQKRIDFLPFASERRFGASLHRLSERDKNRLYLSGSPEYLLDNAASIHRMGRTAPLSSEMRKRLARIQNKYSGEGMRLIGIAYKDVKWEEIPEGDSGVDAQMVEDAVFVGFVVLHDPLRADAADSIRTAQEAGARVIMLTGDNAATAIRIAQEAGIARDGDRVLVGAEIEALSDGDLLKALETIDVFARVLPDQKLRIARLLRGTGEVVAMTGDGINDAPALRSADIGLALGSGTEVAKEASDIILVNDSFTIIVDAIREGRRILDNIKKITAYLLSTSFSEIFVVSGALLVGAPLPLLPAQILWANILEEGFMNFSFAFEPAEDGVMRRDPRSGEMKTILTKSIRLLITLIAIVTGVILMILYFALLAFGFPIEEIRTFMFIALSVDSIFFAFSIKNLHQPIWKINIFSNKYLLGSLFLSTILLLSALTLPPLQKLLSLSPPSVFEFSFLFVVGILNLVIIEAVKYVAFRKITGSKKI